MAGAGSAAVTVEERAPPPLPWSVEKKSATDNVLKVVRDEVVNARMQWVRCTLLADPAIAKAAVEDDNVADKRAGCHECIGRMERVLEEIALIERAE